MKTLEEKKDFIKKCFDNLQKNGMFYNEYKRSGELTYEQLPETMKTGSAEENGRYSWKLSESTVTKSEIEKLENKYNIKFPEWYQAFISTYFHAITELRGKLTYELSEYDEEEDKIVYVVIPQQPENNAFGQIEKLFYGYDELICYGYLPIGNYEDCGPICIDLSQKDEEEDEAQIVFFDHEVLGHCVDEQSCEETAEFMFETFEDFLKCFFLGVEFER